jgi:hypothetical protein
MMVDSTLTPFAMTEQPLNFDLIFERLIADWRPRLTRLTELVIDGPFTALAQLAAYAIMASKWDQFVGLFPRLVRLQLINCITPLDEVSVQALLEQLPVLTFLELAGNNEKLTDTLLCRLANIRPIRTRQLSSLTLPRTRHMSFIGMEAVEAIRAQGLSVNLTYPGSTMSGRPVFRDPSPSPVFSRN